MSTLVWSCGGFSFFARRLIVLHDRDVWETLYCQETCESLTWHMFDAPPQKV